MQIFGFNQGTIVCILPRSQSYFGSPHNLPTKKLYNHLKQILNFKIPKQPPLPPLPPHRTKSPLKIKDLLRQDILRFERNLQEPRSRGRWQTWCLDSPTNSSFPQRAKHFAWDWMRSCVFYWLPQLFSIGCLNCFLLVAHLCGKVVAIASTAAPCKLLAWWSVWRAEPPGSNASWI